MKILILFASFLISIGINAQSNPRKATVEYLQTNTSVITNNEALDLIAKSEFQILLAGENHKDESARQNLKNNLKILQRESEKKFDCLLLEVSQDFQAKMSQVDFLQTLAPASKNFLESFVHLASELNVKLYAIDDKNELLGPNLSHEYIYGIRNNLFMEKIEKLFSDKLCTKAAFVIGAAHLGASSDKLGYKSLNQLIDESGLNAISIYSASPNFPIVNPLAQIKKKHFPTPVGNFALKINRLAQGWSPLLFYVPDHEKASYLEWQMPLFSDLDFLFINR